MPLYRYSDPVNESVNKTRLQRTVFVLLLSLSFLSLSAKDVEITLKAKIKQLVQLRLATIDATNNEERLAANKQFVLFLRDALGEEGSFTTSFDTIPQLNDLRSGDGYFRMINWNVPLDDQTNRYYCFIQFRDRKSKTYSFVELKQGFRGVKGEYRKVFNENDWYGALYYKIIPAKGQNRGRKKTYMLLGWDGHNQYSRIKVVDVLVLNNKNIRFGADIFEIPEKNAKRFILEYKADAAVSLRYDEHRKMIVFNHLVPMQPDLEDSPEFNIPLLEFDALQWKRGKWRYIENVDVRMEDKSREYNNPPLPQKTKVN